MVRGGCKPFSLGCGGTKETPWGKTIERFNQETGEMRISHLCPQNRDRAYVRLVVVS